MYFKVNLVFIYSNVVYFVFPNINLVSSEPSKNMPCRRKFVLLVLQVNLYSPLLWYSNCIFILRCFKWIISFKVTIETNLNINFESQERLQGYNITCMWHVTNLLCKTIYYSLLSLIDWLSRCLVHVHWQIVL